MGFLDSLRKALGGGSARPSSADDSNGYWVYARCRRCGEPLKARVNMMNEPSQEEDDTWIVRKQLSGSGKNYCFQTVEATLHFDAKKQDLLSAEATGGTLISAEEYERLLREQEEQAAQAAAEQPDAPKEE
jgi:hypothetical protein